MELTLIEVKGTTVWVYSGNNYVESTTVSASGLVRDRAFINLFEETPTVHINFEYIPTTKYIFTLPEFILLTTIVVVVICVIIKKIINKTKG